MSIDIRNRKIVAWLMAASTLTGLAGAPALAGMEKRQGPMGRDYLLYLPDKIDKNQTYWVVVGVHGAGGNPKGACGVAGWANEMDNVIVVAPAFPTKGPYFQVLGGKSDDQLIGVLKQLHKEFRLHKKFFMHGFSGGSQYVHRFAAKHYKLIIGVSAHSGGTWEDSPSRGSVMFPWTLSCGLKDTATSGGGNKSRIDYFRTYYKHMFKMNFTAKAFVTDFGHNQTGQVFKAAKECFRVATTGMFDYQREATRGMSPSEREAWLRKDDQMQIVEWTDGVNTYHRKVNPDGWTVNRVTLKGMAKTRKMLDRMAEKAARKAQAHERGCTPIVAGHGCHT